MNPSSELRNWVVYDLNEYDPWGVKGPAFGPMTEAEAKAMEAAGRAAKVPLAYAAVGPTAAVRGER